MIKVAIHSDRIRAVVLAKQTTTEEHCSVKSWGTMNLIMGLRAQPKPAVSPTGSRRAHPSEPIALAFVRIVGSRIKETCRYAAIAVRRDKVIAAVPRANLLLKHRQLIYQHSSPSS